MSWNLVLAVGRRPDLWGEGVRALLAVARRDWWRRAPFLPRPDQSYTAWRLATAHGSPNTNIEPGELISYLEWRREQHRLFGRV
jgi:hypothetical protein